MSNKVIVNGVDMIELIERDTPKKPIKNKNANYECPNCIHGRIEIYNHNGADEELNFCMDCGQRIDWSNE